MKNLNIVIREPQNFTEFNEYYNLRWKILRQPLGQKIDSIKDELDHTIYLIRENYSPIESIKKLVDLENNKISYVYNDNELLVKRYYNSYYKK